MVHKSIFLCVWVSLKASVWFRAKDFCFAFCFLLTINYYYSFISCVWIFYLQLYMYTSSVSGDCGGQKGSHLLEVESQPVVRHCVGAGKETGSFGRTASSFHCWAIFQFWAHVLDIYFSGHITSCLGEIGELSVAAKLGVLDLPFVHVL